MITLTPTPPFDFIASATSHGWLVLHPNSWDEDTKTLQRAERLSEHLGSGKVVRLRIYGGGSPLQPQIEIDADSPDPLTPAEQEEIRATVAHMFRLDEDFSPFYTLCEQRGEPWSKLSSGLGRLLRSPTVFEDVVKTICTTNIQWGGTRGMVKRLVEVYGEPCPVEPALHAFPTPQALAASPFEQFAVAVRMGYRAEYVHSLALQVSYGELDLEALKSSTLPTPELRKVLLGLRGVGPYAAATLLMLLGRYDEVGIDTYYRILTAKKYFNGEYPGDRQASHVYDSWGAWKYLAYWFDAWSA